MGIDVETRLRRALAARAARVTPDRLRPAAPPTLVPAHHRPALPLPGRWRRLLVAGSVAVVLAAGIVAVRLAGGVAPDPRPQQPVIVPSVVSPAPSAPPSPAPLASPVPSRLPPGPSLSRSGQPDVSTDASVASPPNPLASRSR
jgi:hypothetical protein